MKQAGVKQADKAELAAFLAKYDPDIATRAEAILTRMRELLPTATELVYDNYNALAIGFGASDKSSEAVFSIAVYPRWVSLFFLQGAVLDDPAKLLKGKGSVARHIVLPDAAALDEPALQTLFRLALDNAKVPFDPNANPRVIVKSVSAKQRPRRPA